MRSSSHFEIDNEKDQSLLKDVLMSYERFCRSKSSTPDLPCRINQEDKVIPTFLPHLLFKPEKKAIAIPKTKQEEAIAWVEKQAFIDHVEREAANGDDGMLNLLERSSKEFKVALIRRIKNPYLINQLNFNTCGVVCMLNIIAKKYPLVYAKIAYDLISCGETHYPFHFKLRKTLHDNKTSARNLDEMMLTSWRHAKNYVFSLKSNRFADLAALTKPQEIEDWLRLLCVDASENQSYFVEDRTRVLHADNLKSINVGIKLTFAIWQNTKEKFKDLNVNLHESVKQFNVNPNDNVMVMLVDSVLSKILTGSYSAEKDDPFLSIESTHYININAITIEVKKVYVEFDTWGMSYKKTISLADFLKGYRGCILGTLPRNLNYENALLKYIVPERIGLGKKT